MNCFLFFNVYKISCLSQCATNIQNVQQHFLYSNVVVFFYFPNGVRFSIFGISNKKQNLQSKIKICLLLVINI